MPTMLHRPPAESPAPAPATPELPFWKRVLFSAVLLGVVLGSLELSARWYLRAFEGFDGEHFLQYEFDAYKNINLTPGFVDTRGVRHNEQGFRRSEEVPREKPAGTYRIFLMGGSTAYGTGGLWPHLQRDFAVLDNRETIDAYLERILAGAIPGQRVEVINAAIPSIWSHHHLIYLNQRILGYQPDMVLFLDGFNDYYFTDPGHDQFATYAYNEHAHVIMGPPTVRALGYANMWWLSRRSALVYVGFRVFRNVKAWWQAEPDPDRTPMDVERSLAGLRTTFQRNALKMVHRNTALLRDEGVEAVVILQPMLALERAEMERMPEMERRLFHFNVDSYLPNYEAFIHRAVPLVSELARERVEANGGTFVDATPVFRGRRGAEQIFTDYVHLTPEGNRILAEYIAERILPLMPAVPAAAPSTD